MHKTLQNYLHAQNYYLNKQFKTFKTITIKKNLCSCKTKLCTLIYCFDIDTQKKT